MLEDGEHRERRQHADQRRYRDQARIVLVDEVIEQMAHSFPGSIPRGTPSPQG